MGKLFDKQVNNEGLSRKKILFFGSVLAITIVAIVFYGAFAKDKSIVSEDIKPYAGYNNRETDILAKVKHTNESAYMSASSPKAAVKVVESVVSVPPIVDNEEVQFKHQLIQVKQKQLLKQLDSENNGISSKTLMFSKFSKNMESASSGVVSSGSSTSSVANHVVSGNESNSSKAYYGSEIIDLKSPYELKAGSVIPSTMINGINSDLPGEVIAFVRNNVYDSVSRQYLLIPQGSKLVGLYDSNVAYGQQRVAVAWNRLIYPNGSSVDLKATPGTDIAGYSGFYDQVDNKYWQIFGTSFIMGVITAGMQYSQNNVNTNVQSGGYANPTVGQTLAGSLGQQLGQTALSVTQKNLNVAPTLIIRQGYQFNIMLTADLILKPWNKN
jgi:type IV secretory pathway VirB10-like protein